MIAFVTPWLTLIIGIFQFCGGQEDRLSVQGRWQDNIRPKLFAHLSTRDYQSFSGILLNDPSTGGNSSSREIGNSLRYLKRFFLILLSRARKYYGGKVFFVCMLICILCLIVAEQ